MSKKTSRRIVLSGVALVWLVEYVRLQPRMMNSIELWADLVIYNVGEIRRRKRAKQR